MELKLLRTFFAVLLFAVTGHSWATISLPVNVEPKWNDISSIVWSTDGTNWGNSALTVGQSVSFKFTLFKQYDGKHYADFIKSWIDWDGNDQFSPEETLLVGSHVVHNRYKRNTQTPDNLVNQSFDFVSSPVDITSAMVGERFLLARVTCSESLLATAGITGDWSRQWRSAYTSNDNAKYNELFTPTDEYFQGASELVKLTVNRQQVPEPNTLALLAVAMVGLGFGRRQATRT